MKKTPIESSKRQYDKEVRTQPIFLSWEAFERTATVQGGLDYFMRVGGILKTPGGEPLEIKRILEAASMPIPDTLIVNFPELLALAGCQSQFEIPGQLWELLHRVAQDERPCAIAHMETSKQVCMNQKFADLLETPSEDVVSRVSRNGWNAEDYEQMSQLARQESSFEMLYRSWWNPATWGIMAAQIDILDLPTASGGVTQFRLNRNYHAAPKMPPDDIRRLTELDFRAA